MMSMSHSGRRELLDTLQLGNGAEEFDRPALRLAALTQPKGKP